MCRLQGPRCCPHHPQVRPDRHCHEELRAAPKGHQVAVGAPRLPGWARKPVQLQHSRVQRVSVVAAALHILPHCCVQQPGRIRLIRLQHSKGHDVTSDLRPSPSPALRRQQRNLVHLTVRFAVRGRSLASLRGASNRLSILGQHGPGQSAQADHLAVHCADKGGGRRCGGCPAGCQLLLSKAPVSQHKLITWLSIVLTKEGASLRGVSSRLPTFAQQGPVSQHKLLTWLSIVLTKEGASLRGVSMPPESS